jgi:hypothetical protein
MTALRKIPRILRHVEEREEGEKAKEEKEETMVAGVEVRGVTGGQEQEQRVGESSGTEKEAVNSVTGIEVASSGVSNGTEAATGKGDVEDKVGDEGEDQQLRSKRSRDKDSLFTLDHRCVCWWHFFFFIYMALFSS